MPDYSEAEDNTQNQQQLSDEGVQQEMVSKFMADVVFGKETDVINFVYNNRSLGQKIKDWIVDTLGITVDGSDVLTIIEKTAWKLGYRNIVSTSDGKSRPMNDTEYKAKLKAASHIDELATASKFKNTKLNVKKREGELSDIKEWDYREAYFLDGDTKTSNYYKLIISVGKSPATGRIVYNIGDIKKVSFPGLTGSKALGKSPQANETSLDNKISQNESTVNTSIRDNNRDDTAKYDKDINETEQASNDAETAEDIKEAVKSDDEINFVGSQEESKQNLANDEDMGYKENDINQLLELSTCTKDELTNYLHKIDDINNTNYSDEFIANSAWLDKIQIPKGSYVLNSDSTINWSQAPKGGYVLDNAGNAIKDEYIPKVGEIIDRYGESNGRYVSPVVGEKSYTFTQRSLPYIENLANYHRYEVIGDFTKIKEYIFNCPDLKVKAQADAYITKYYDGEYNGLISYYGKVAKIDGWGTGGANQYELPLEIELLVKLRLLKEL